MDLRLLVVPDGTKNVIAELSNAFNKKSFAQLKHNVHRDKILLIIVFKG